MKNVVIYPRGFAGYDVGHPILRLENNLTEQVAVSRFSKINSRETNAVAAQNVIDLYKVAGSLVHTNYNPEFIEEAYSVFINAFGTHNLFEWCTIQKQNPFFTDMHASFVIDTLKYLTTGKRSFSFGTWLATLKHGVGQTTQPDFKFEEYFLRDKGIVNVQTAATKWLSRRDGIGDMINTLNVIFGK